MTMGIITSYLLCHSSFVFCLSHLLFLSDHYVRQSTVVITFGWQMADGPMAEGYVEPCNVRS